jgi:hypothetical protein
MNRIFLVSLLFMFSNAFCMDKHSTTEKKPQLGFNSTSPQFKMVYLSIVKGRPKPTSQNVQIFEEIANTCPGLQAQAEVILGMYYLKIKSPMAESYLINGLNKEEGRSCAYYLTHNSIVRDSDAKKSIEAIKANNPL